MNFRFLILVNQLKLCQHCHFVLRICIYKLYYIKRDKIKWNYSVAAGAIKATEVLKL